MPRSPPVIYGPLAPYVSFFVFFFVFRPRDIEGHITFECGTGALTSPHPWGPLLAIRYTHLH
ncbi:hypothetical protein BS50DRAFT_578590 [Corynespora cassiicola Philippines]|uniref:Uncharacterized protein n=1 Tax=Corynespora cassiicola Philippines TaxID=1448308 RepID=A0A2T2N6Z4_CORCC|nr:hypothetical protein BS50DRAFT_578590 [Corynespora cassiicola Philippines]